MALRKNDKAGHPLVMAAVMLLAAPAPGLAQDAPPAGGPPPVAEPVAEPGSATAQGGAAEPGAAAEPGDNQGTSTLVQGEPNLVANGEQRVILKDGDFTIVPPKDWEVYTDLPGLTMLMQIPYKPGQGYQRTIQVASFTGGRFIDDITAKEFEETIVRKFASASGSVEDYRVRNHMAVEMVDGRDGLLYYTEFTIDSVPLMQMHVLVASQDRHYLVTFTDLAENFERDDNPALMEAWTAITSVQLGTRTPVRHRILLWFGIAAAALLVIGGIVVGVRTFMASRSYATYADGKGLDDVQLTEDDKIPMSMAPVNMKDIDTGPAASRPAMSTSEVSEEGLDDDELFKKQDDQAV